MGPHVWLVIHSPVEVDRVVKGRLTEVAEKLAVGADAVLGLVNAQVHHVLRRTHREHIVRRVVVVQGEPDLFEIVGALNPPRRLARSLDGRQEQRDQDRDDRDHDQQLDECKPQPFSKNWLEIGGGPGAAATALAE